MIISILSLIIALKNDLFLFYGVCFFDDNNFEKRLMLKIILAWLSNLISKIWKSTTTWLLICEIKITTEILDAQLLESDRKEINELFKSIWPFCEVGAERANIYMTDEYLGSCQTPMMERFCKKVDGF